MVVVRNRRGKRGRDGQGKEAAGAGNLREMSYELGSYFTNMKTEAQRSPVTFLRSHSKSVTPWAFAYSSEFHLLHSAEVTWALNYSVLHYCSETSVPSGRSWRQAFVLEQRG